MNPALNPALKAARRLAADPRSDRELLDAIASRRDPDALAELLRRHAASVRRVAADVCPAAEDDVAQAAFVLLVERSAELVGRESAAGWLFEVARRLALKARTAAARRTRQEAGATPPAPSAEPLDELTFREVRAIVAEELAQLPDGLRVPLVLHYWEGATHAEVATRLGYSTSTAKRRLEAGRERLGARLARRGLTGAGILAALTALSASQAAARTSIPTGLAELLVASSTGARRAMSAGAAELLQGTVRAAPAKVLTVAACVLVLGAGLAFGIASSTLPSLPPEVPLAPVTPASFVRAPAKDVPPRFDAVGDPLPPGVVARLGTVRLRHAQKLTSVVALLDGKTVASGGQDGTIRFWDAATGKELHRFPGQHITLSPDGKTWASWSMWRTSGRPDGSDDKIRLWDLATGKQLREFTRSGGTFAVAFSPDGKVLVAGGSSTRDVATVPVNQLSLWDVESGKELPAPQMGKGYDSVGHLEFSPDGKLLATAEFGWSDWPDESTHLWDLATGKEVQGFNVVTKGGRISGVRSLLVFSPDGKSVASCAKWDEVGPEHKFSAICLWDVATGKELRRFESPGIGACTALLFTTPDGTLISGHDGSICVWEASTGKLLRTLKGHADAVTCLSLSRDGKTLVSGSEDHTVRLWDFATGKSLLPDTGHSAPVISVGLSPDNKTVISAGGDKTIRLWNLATGKETRRVVDSAPIHSSALAPNGKLLATQSWSPASRDVTVRLWDLDTGKPLHQLPKGTGLSKLAFSPDSKILAAASYRSVTLYDTVTSKEVARAGIPKDESSRGFVAFSPEGKMFAWFDSGSYTCCVSETATGKELNRFKVNPDFAVAWGTFLDGQTLLLGVKGNFLTDFILWDLAKGQAVAEIPVQYGTVISAALSRDGKTLATGGADGTIRLWDIATGKVRHTLRGHQRAEGDESYAGVTALAWSADGTRLVSGGADTTVLVWDVSALK